MKNTTRRKESNFTLVNFFSLLVFWTVGMGFLDDWGMLKISRENGSLSVLVVVAVRGWANPGAQRGRINRRCVR